MLIMEICVTRFNRITFEENENFRNKNNIKCIYSCPVKISNNILPNKDLIILEMNNSTNTIEGLGLIKNKLYLKNKYKIYSDNNYNRYTYLSNFRIDKNQLKNDLGIIRLNELENLLFNSYKHCKRGQGIQIIPKHIKKNINEINYCKFLNDYIKLVLELNK